MRSEKPTLWTYGSIFDKPGLLQVFLDLFSVSKRPFPCSDAMLVEGAVVVEYIDGGRLCFAQEVVVHVVRRRHLQAAGTEFDIDVLIPITGMARLRAG